MTSSIFQDKSVLVTGGVGSIGRELVRQLLLHHNPKRVRILDNNESALFDLEQSWSGRHERAEYFQCDITNASELERQFSGIDICIHAAALKHVPSCERSPFSALSVNVGGVENVTKAALHNGVEKVLFTSSDKAVNPTNVMGTSKLMGERLFTAMNDNAGQSGQHTVFSSTRFGNVAGSSGSVIPLFEKQIIAGGPITLTDERMTRFIMSNADAVSLVLRSVGLARGGEIFITRMPVLRIADLARAMIERLAPLYGKDPGDIEVHTVGPRPGEKLWEELSTHEESRRIYQSEDFLVVFPPLATDIEARVEALSELRLEKTDRVYHSDCEPCMSDEQISAFLDRVGVSSSGKQANGASDSDDSTEATDTADANTVMSDSVS